MDSFKQHYTLEKNIEEEVNAHPKHTYEQEFGKTIRRQVQKKKLNQLKEIIETDKHTSKLTKMVAKSVEKDEIFISHNVISLFTKTPVDVTLHIVPECLKEDGTLKKRTNLTVDDISTFLNFVAKST